MALVPDDGNGHPEFSGAEMKHDRDKRAFDVFFSAMALLLISPVLAAIALLIRATSSGDVIYKKMVLGRGGCTIFMLKFRTMYPDAEHRLRNLLATDVDARKEWETNQKLRNDPRITPIGRVLRRFSLDELPQFWNVLRGDLSVVGPRPYWKEAEWYVGDQTEIFHRSANDLLSVRPGITGIWATSGRAQLSFKDRIHLDLLYIRRRSLCYDVYLILKTIPSVVFSRGAY